MKAFDLACSLPWAIRPDALQAILDKAARVEVAAEKIALAMSSGTPEAVAAKLGRPLDNARTVTVRDGVAVIPVEGPIFRRANLFTQISSATSTEVLAADIRTAADDPSVSAILLEIDSPGGEVSGTAELASMIRAATDKKPVWAYVDDLGASAAYWLASATDRIVAAPTAILGSIGVVATVRDPSSQKATDIEFVSSKSPRKRADVTTEAGRAQVQSVVDALADVFIADVARYRGVSTDTVESEFGQGDVFVGRAAVDAGLADEIGSFEGALAALGAAAAKRGAPTPIRRAAMSFKDKFFALLDGLDAPASADEEAAIVTANIDHQPAAPAQSPPAQPTADVSALTERMAALEAELTAAKALSETQAASIEKLAGENKALALSARRKRFTDEVLGKGKASGIRWAGDPEQHVAMLEHLADSAGEESPIFAGYIQQQRAHAEQIKAAGLFSEAGSGRHGSTGGDAGGRLETMAHARVSEGKASSFGAAMGQLEKEQPALFADYRKAQTLRD